MAELLLMHKRIILEACPALYDRPFTLRSFNDDWDVRQSNWHFDDDALWGRNPQPGPGVLISRRAFPGNVLLDFHAQTVLPSTHDIDVMWNMNWDEAANTRGAAYVAGIQGWWEGKVGIERSPEYRLGAAAPCPWFVPGREYHIQVRSIDGHCFVFVDGVLRIELFDPAPIDSRQHNRVGFECYQSMVRIRSLVVRQIVWEKRPLAYAPEF